VPDSDMLGPMTHLPGRRVSPSRDSYIRLLEQLNAILRDENQRLRQEVYDLRNQWHWPYRPYHPFWY